VIGGFDSTRDHKGASLNFQAQNGLTVAIHPVAFSEECQIIDFNIVDVHIVRPPKGWSRVITRMPPAGIFTRRRA
jgi:hypothetical protein